MSFKYIALNILKAANQHGVSAASGVKMVAVELVAAASRQVTRPTF